MQRKRVRKSPAKVANVAGADNEETSEYYYEYIYEYISDNDYSNSNPLTDPEEYISEDEIPLQNIHSAKRTPQSVKSVKSVASASQRSLPTTQGLSPVPTSKSSIRSPMKSPSKSPIKVPHPPAAFGPNKFVSPRRAIVVSYANQNKRPEILKNDENTPRNNRDIPKPQFILVPEDQIKVENMNNNRAKSEGKKRRNSDGEQVQAITDAIKSQEFLVNKEIQQQPIPKAAKTPQTRRLRRANSPRRSMTPNEVQNIRHELAKENFNNEEMKDNNIRRITTTAFDDDITPRRKRRVAPPSQQRVPTYISPRSLTHENNSQASNSINVHAKSPRNYYVTPQRDLANIDISSDDDSDVTYN
ncbi:hypothetical protein TVAG_325680 [Trichomonas vaginalis G3]|uniref:Uncharacterized protein n=1 Tax=Trichomonas vaginalis (strain ATCC PRA-98 / G3) TaxID=412133 RepID=A2EWG9_TRIV3|nr:hypothetical protein TVAGG3_0877080 [Trichomonas vaginalis G3]EAY02996.1 hypothetical protein TVAG_325680 [Trichomonas vaginalis G3]KAI5501767.1 hypothetical protein TVAGG3_0877080 [Trichomonas vaginalis G3]|eukprot:XP_001315219.1 hypothetical protein [Trichomonas vaginalis G3]